MKPIGIVALVAFAATQGTGSAPAKGPAKAPVTAPAPTSALEDSLVAMEKQSWVAWKSRDGKFFERFLSDDHIEMGVGGPSNKSTVVAGVASPACVVQSYTVDKFKFTLFDANTAALTYHVEQHTLCGGHPVPSPAWATSVYTKRHGRWYNAIYQQSPTPRPAAASAPPPAGSNAR